MAQLWPASATLAYNMGLKAGMTSQQATDFAGAQHGESGFNPNAVNKSSGAAGLYQLLSPGYVEKAKALGGVFKPEANIGAILPDYAAYYKSHPQFVPGAAASAVERSGEGAQYYAKGTKYLMSLGNNRGEQVSNVATQLQQNFNETGDWGSAIDKLGQPTAGAGQGQPQFGMSVQQLVAASKPSARAVGLLAPLGGIAQRAAQGSQQEIPFPKTVGELSSTKGPVKVQVDHGQEPSEESASAVKLAQKYLGTPYLWGGADPRKGFDCSGFAQYIYRQQGVNLPRTTYQQIKVGTPVKDPSQLQPGDLMFFATEGGKAPTHEGIYIGNGEFIHAPHTGDVVKVSSLNSDYYQQHFLGGRRVTAGQATAT